MLCSGGKVKGNNLDIIKQAINLWKKGIHRISVKKFFLKKERKKVIAECTTNMS